MYNKEEKEIKAEIKHIKENGCNCNVCEGRIILLYKEIKIKASFWILDKIFGNGKISEENKCH